MPIFLQIKIFCRKRQFLFLCYFIFIILFLLLGLEVAHLVDWDENVYSEASRQMIQRKDYINIYLNGDLFHEKPPFFLWLQVLSYKIFGINEFSARFPSSVISGLTVLLLIFTGKYLYSLRLGMLWALVYITSFMPSILSRSAVLDATFNFWIFTALVCWFLYDEKKKQNLEQKTGKTPYYFFLLLAAVSMGLAVLSKGILGGAIPVFTYLLYKIFCPFPRISFLDFFICGLVSILVAGSWFLANFFVSGIDYLKYSIEFQKKLLLHSAQGHSGPFYYHFVVLFFGLFPWTPFLFARFQKRFVWNPFKSKNIPTRLKKFSIFCICQLIFILLIFSFTKNKLPHYSASAYFSLALLISFVWDKNFQKNIFSKKILFFFFGFCLFMSSLFFSLHWIMQSWLDNNNIPFLLQPSTNIYFTGISLFLGSVLVLFFYFRNKKMLIVTTIAIMSFCLSQGLWRLQLPIFQQFSQDVLVQQVINLQKKGKVVFYQFTAVAPIFYGKKPIPTYGSSIFPEPSLDLQKASLEKVFIITKGKKNNHKLQNEPFAIKFIKQVADLYIYEKKN